MVYIKHTYNLERQDNKETLTIAKHIEYWDAKSLLVRQANADHKQIAEKIKAEHPNSEYSAFVGRVTVFKHDDDNYDILITALSRDRKESSVIHIKLEKHLFNKTWTLTPRVKYRIVKSGLKIPEAESHAD